MKPILEHEGREFFSEAELKARVAERFSEELFAPAEHHALHFGEIGIRPDEHFFSFDTWNGSGCAFALHQKRHRALIVVRSAAAMPPLFFVSRGHAAADCLVCE